MKRLHRLIVLSSVYRQSSRDHAEYRKSDPLNLLLWRQNRRRLDLEAMRDSILAVSGTLLVPSVPISDVSPKPPATQKTSGMKKKSRKSG